MAIKLWSMDWFDETLLFYAKSIKTYNLPDCPWARAYPMVKTLSTDYETKLDTLERYRLQDEKQFKEIWNRKCEDHEVESSITPNSSLG